jgi:hypothetical protein
MFFAIGGPGERPIRVNECGRDDASHFVVARIGSGSSIGVTLCFVAHKSDDGRMLVPYATKTVSVRMPDGTIIENLPAGVSRAEGLALLKERGYDISKLEAVATSLPSAQSSEQRLKQDPVDQTRRRYWTMGERYSTEVTSYAEGVAAGFELSADDGEEAARRLWDARLSQWKVTAQVMSGGLVIGWLLVAALGWIVRGFLGIPRGKDARLLG